MTHTVGDLARRTGLTTRTLHHYETLGLLRPAQRSAAGYRLYDETSIARLHAVLAYRYLGLPLKEIAALLADDPPPLRELLRRQAALVEERIARHQRLLRALNKCTRSLDEGAPALDEELLGLITITRLCEESLTADDYKVIADARTTLGAEGLVAVQAESAQLLKDLEAARARGADPGSAPVLALSRRAEVLRHRVAGADKALHDKIRGIGTRAPALMRAHGLTPELIEYSRLAREAFERTHAADVAADTKAAKPRATRKKP
jgi:DNA-binding transcriptional MerR regulator